MVLARAPLILQSQCTSTVVQKKETIETFLMRHFLSVLVVMTVFYFFLSYFIYSRVFYSQLTFLIQPDLPNLGSLLGLSQGPVFSQAPVLVLDYRWYEIHPPIEGLLLPACIEPTPFRNSACKVAGLQGACFYIILLNPPITD